MGGMARFEKEAAGALDVSESGGDCVGDGEAGCEGHGGMRSTAVADQGMGRVNGYREWARPILLEGKVPRMRSMSFFERPCRWRQRDVEAGMRPSAPLMALLPWLGVLDGGFSGESSLPFG